MTASLRWALGVFHPDGPLVNKADVRFNVACYHSHYESMGIPHVSKVFSHASAILRVGVACVRDLRIERFACRTSGPGNVFAS